MCDVMGEWPRNVLAGYAHVPLVAFEGVEQIELTAGAMVTLPFGVWHTLDGAFPDEDRRYERTAPLFFRAQYPVDHFDESAVGDVFEAVLDDFQQRSGRAHLALLLATPGRIPEPAFSATYVKRWATGQYVRRFGPFEREAILFGDRERRAWVITPGEVAAIVRADALLAREDCLLTDRGCVRALDTLRLTARPEYSLQNGFVLTTAAIEALLNPAAERPLGGVFARRAAALFGDVERDPDEARTFFKQVYSVRSELMHGGNPSQAIEKLGMEPARCFYLGRALLAQALMRFARWKSGRGSGDWQTFRQQLEEADGDRSRARALRVAWAEPEE
jgi:hypothetical protein